LIKLTYIGTDDFYRPVFKGDNDRLYKTASPPRTGFDNLTDEERLFCLQDLYTLSELNGEPDFPCWKNDKFELIQEDKMKKPKVKLVGADGNVFNLMGICHRALTKEKMANEAKEMVDKIIKTAESYDEALAIMMEYCDVE
jgi:hypothetical protein